MVLVLSPSNLSGIMPLSPLGLVLVLQLVLAVVQPVGLHLVVGHWPLGGVYGLLEVGSVG